MVARAQSRSEEGSGTRFPLMSAALMMTLPLSPPPKAVY